MSASESSQQILNKAMDLDLDPHRLGLGLAMRMGMRMRTRNNSSTASRPLVVVVVRRAGTRVRSAPTSQRYHSVPTHALDTSSALRAGAVDVHRASVWMHR